MKVDVLEALLASIVLYGVGSNLFWLNKTIITWTADAVFGRFQIQGTEALIRLWNEEEKEEEEEEAKLVPAVSSECQDLKPPPVQVIDDVGKKCD